MNNSFNFRLLSHLTPKKEGQGFTLVELLVALIIVGVLVAVALPNLLGQVGKAREAEGKTGVGTLMRAQQAYHLEKRRFFGPWAAVIDLSSPTNGLGVVVTSRYYNFTGIRIEDDEFLIDNGFPQFAGQQAQQAMVSANPVDGVNQGIRGFGGVMAYNQGRYRQILCVSRNINATSGGYITLSALFNLDNAHCYSDSALK